MNYIPIVTIAIPTYERYDYFEDALNSALNQSIETPIIVVDNGSSHNKFEICCSNYKGRVQYFRNSCNIEMFPNWNRCAKLTNTEYLIILGDDDILPFDFIDKFIRIQNKIPNLGVYYSDVIFLKHEKSKITSVPSNWKNIWELHSAKELKEKALDFELQFPSIASIICKQLLVNQPFIEKIHAANDKQFFYNLPNDTIFYGDKNNNYYYRFHLSNDSNNKKVIPNLILAHFIIYFNCLPYCKNKFRSTIKIYKDLINYFFKYRNTFYYFMSVDSYYSKSIEKMTSINNLFYILISAFLLAIKYFYILFIFLMKIIFNKISPKNNI
jgi:hypothetical protein